MSGTQVQVNVALRVAAAEMEISRLQGRCAHKFELVEQRHIDGHIGLSTMFARVYCPKCRLTVMKEFNSPLCPAHMVEMELARDAVSQKMSEAREKVLDAQWLGYFAACTYHCKHKGCEERMVLDQWDR